MSSILVIACEESTEHGRWRPTTLHLTANKLTVTCHTPHLAVLCSAHTQSPTISKINDVKKHINPAACLTACWRLLARTRWRTTKFSHPTTQHITGRSVLRGACTSINTLQQLQYVPTRVNQPGASPAAHGPAYLQQTADSALQALHTTNHKIATRNAPREKKP
jgi:hypothetical protein